MICDLLVVGKPHTRRALQRNISIFRETLYERECEVASINIDIVRALGLFNIFRMRQYKVIGRILQFEEDVSDIDFENLGSEMLFIHTTADDLE